MRHQRNSGHSVSLSSHLEYHHGVNLLLSIVSRTYAQILETRNSVNHCILLMYHSYEYRSIQKQSLKHNNYHSTWSGMIGSPMSNRWIGSFCWPLEGSTTSTPPLGISPAEKNITSFKCSYGTCLQLHVQPRYTLRISIIILKDSSQ